MFARAGWSLTFAILTTGCSNALAPTPSPPLLQTASVGAAVASASLLGPTGSPGPSDGHASPTATPASADAAKVACTAILDDIPLVIVNSGKPTLAAAYEMTGAQLTNYFTSRLNFSSQSNGSDWWDQPTKLVDMCLYDGDFNTMTPGPPGHDTSAARVLVVISQGEAQFWASTLNEGAIPEVDPAGISGQCPNQAWPPYGAPDPVPGISVTAIDKGHTEIINTTSRTYYYEVSLWPTGQLVCGHGRYEQAGQLGPIHAGKTVVFGEASTPDTPLTIKIWDALCGEGCDRPPVATYVVPVSTIEPVPMST